MPYQPDFDQQTLEDIPKCIDNLIDALGGDSACTMRRAIVLIDIDQHPGTTQAEVLARLGGTKSSLNRDIEWLYDYGCIMRKAHGNDARLIELYSCSYAKKNLELALLWFSGSHEGLKDFLTRFIRLFNEYRPTLRDAKIVAILGSKKEGASRQEVFAELPDVAQTTYSRTLANLAALGLIDRDGQDNETGQ